MDIPSLVVMLKATSLSVAIRQNPWVWPISEMLHFAGLSLLLGAIGLLDLRLIGFMRRIPVSALRGLLPYGLLGFVLNLVTGAIFFIGAPDQYIRNEAFYYKLGFIVLAGANALFFETTQGHRLLEIEATGRTPAAFRIAGVVSIVSWFMVLYWGRMLPFIGNAF
jgi:hypothetical protein